MSTVTAVPLQPVKRGYLIWLWLGIALACVSAFALARQGDPALVREARSGGVMTTPSGLQYKLIKAGQPGAPRPTDADVVRVQYRGRLLDGSVFDQSQQPAVLPVTGVVPGFSEALKLMPRGSVYRFWIPGRLGYGATPPPGSPIGPDATLVFDVALIDFIPEALLRQMQRAQQQGGAPGGPAGSAAPALPPGVQP